MIVEQDRKGNKSGPNELSYLHNEVRDVSCVNHFWLLLRAECRLLYTAIIVLP